MKIWPFEAVGALGTSAAAKAPRRSGCSPWRLPHPREPMWRPDSQERQECPVSGHGCPGGVELVLGLHQECPGVVKLVMELNHVSQVGNQEELQDGGASVWASSCEFRW